MTGKRKTYKTYTKEFKLEAVRLMRESGRPASECSLAPSSPFTGDGLFVVPH